VRLVLLLAAALAAALPGAALAQSAARGADRAAHYCVNCHGADGRSQQAGIPSLAGQPAEFITLQMILFREGIRQVPAMTPFAANMADSDIEDIAAFFAALPPGPPDDRAPREPALFARGEALAARLNCGVCHLTDFRGRNQVPRIAGQREDFLAATMAEYRDGVRVGTDSNMNGAVAGLSNADLAALAHYLAQRD
jgi:cytochrome c553